LLPLLPGNPGGYLGLLSSMSDLLQSPLSLGFFFMQLAYMVVGRLPVIPAHDPWNFFFSLSPPGINTPDLSAHPEGFFWSFLFFSLTNSEWGEFPNRFMWRFRRLPPHYFLFLFAPVATPFFVRSVTPFSTFFPDLSVCLGGFPVFFFHRSPPLSAT